MDIVVYLFFVMVGILIGIYIASWIMSKED